MKGSLYLALFVVSGILAISFAFHIYRRYNAKGAKPFAVSSFSVGLWAFNSAFRVLATEVWQTQFLLFTEVVAVSVTSYYWFQFTSELSGRWPANSIKRDDIFKMIAGFMVVGFFLSATNVYHGLMWSSIEPIQSSGMTSFDITKNIGHYVFMATAYGLYFAGLGYLLLLSKENRSASSLVLVLLSPLAIVGANIIPYLNGLQAITHGTTATAVGAPVSFVLAALAVEQSLLDVRPVARESVFKEVPEPVLVLDFKRRIAECNDAFLENVSNPSEGEPFSEALPEIESKLDFDKLNEEQRVSYDGKYYQISISEVEIGTTTAGYLLVFQDVTSLVNSIQEVNRHNEQLETLSDSVAHELRNPLTVVQGFAEVLSEGKPLPEGDELDGYGDRIQRNAERMKTILSDFMTTINASATVSNVSTVSIKGELDNIRKGDTDTSNIDEYRIPDTIDTITAESFRVNLLLKVLLNFVNSHATTNDYTFVSIVTKNDGGTLVLTSNIDLNSKHEDSLLKHGYTTKHSGSGLGLSMIETLANAHYWDIDLDINERSFTITINGLTDSAPIDRDMYENWIQQGQTE